MSSTNGELTHLKFDDLSVYEDKMMKKLPADLIPMVAKINEQLPVAMEDMKYYGKSSSQFKDLLLNSGMPTVMTCIYQATARIKRTRNALRETQLKYAENEVIIEAKQQEFKETDNLLRKKFLKVEIAKIQSDMDEGSIVIAGAIKKLSYYLNYFNELKKQLAKEGRELNEQTIEELQAEDHIATAFTQAIDESRAKNKMAINAGEQIYFRKLGIPQENAKLDILQFFADEVEYLDKNPGKILPLDMEDKFIKKMIDKYKHCPKELAKRRGVTLLHEDSIIK